MSNNIHEWAVRSAHQHAAAQPAPGAELSREAVRLLLALDATRSVRALPTHYPHVMNRLAREWSDPAAAQRCLDGLLLTSRSGRQGFPPAVITELMLLQSRNGRRLPPPRQDVWSQTLLR